jgi:hypothetical protein
MDQRFQILDCVDRRLGGSKPQIRGFDPLDSCASYGLKWPKLSIGHASLAPACNAAQENWKPGIDAKKVGS